MRLSLFSRESEDSNGLKEMLAQVIPESKVRTSPREQTKDLKDALDSIRPVSRGKVLGGEAQTFLECSECKKMTCPACCGVCPVTECCKTLCRKCKRGDPWGPCRVHNKTYSRSSEESRPSTDEGRSMSPLSPSAQALRLQWLADLDERYAEDEKMGKPRAFWQRRS